MYMYYNKTCSSNTLYMYIPNLKCSPHNVDDIPMYFQQLFFNRHAVFVLFSGKVLILINSLTI